MVRATSKSLLVLASLLSLATAYPIRREVPQEHSHEQFLRTTNEFLKKNNPIGIVDAVFGLLGNAAASTGQGTLNNPDCLQTATADTAFTNAKAEGSVAGMTAALIYRAVERNTGSVGLASVTCQGFTPVNKEIAAISQHQDPASNNAAAINKAITLELAKQIASIGGNPEDALKSGTFAPGQIGDPTAAGNTCDDPNDAVGCIFTLNRLVEDASVAEISAAVAGVDVSQPSATQSDTAAPPANTGNAGGNGAGNGGLGSKNQNTGQCQVDGGAAPPPAGGAGAGGDDGADTGDDGADTGDDTGDNVDDGNVGDGNVDNGNGGNTDTCPPAATVTVTATAAPSATDSSSTADVSSTTAAPSATQPAATTTSAAAPSGTAPAAPVNTGNINFGNCKNPSVSFGAGLDGRKLTEFSFIPTDQTDFAHGSALNSQIIFQFVCDTLVNKCGFKRGDDLVNKCDAARASVANIQKDPKAADIFNAALGFQSDFGSIDVNAPPASVTTPDVDANGKPTFRKCTNPSVLFAPGLEGRAATEFTFKPVDTNQFNHGSAKNAQIIYQFVCDTLVNVCGFTNDDATVKDCRATQQAVLPLGNVGRSADEFNASIGFTTTNCQADDSCA